MFRSPRVSDCITSVLLVDLNRHDRLAIVDFVGLPWTRSFPPKPVAIHYRLAFRPLLYFPRAHSSVGFGGTSFSA